MRLFPVWFWLMLASSLFEWGRAFLQTRTRNASLNSFRHSLQTDHLMNTFKVVEKFWLWILSFKSFLITPGKYAFANLWLWAEPGVWWGWVREHRILPALPGGTSLSHGVLTTCSFVHCFVPFMFLPRPKSCFELLLFILYLYFQCVCRIFLAILVKPLHSAFVSTRALRHPPCGLK